MQGRPSTRPTRRAARVPRCRCAGSCRCGGLVPFILYERIERDCEFFREVP
jgi:hypothetical protein